MEFDLGKEAREGSEMSELCSLLERHCHEDICYSPIPRLVLCRAMAATTPSPVMYRPLFCFIARGRKRVFLGGEVFEYNPESYLVASVDLPVSGQVLEAPFLGFTLILEPAMLASLLLEMPATATAQPSRGLAVNALEDDLRDPVLRLLRLLDQPRDIPVMAPLIEREILYRLLLGPRGEMLRQRALPASSQAQISRAVELIRSRFHESLRIEDLAQHAGMSAPSFHRHFRAVTAMSPLQFQKQVRLQEARRMLLTEGVNASTVAFEVGYESPSQFSREYRRLFGTPPARDTTELRKTMSAARA
jgi:AraC-like DNA-binding protein